MVSGQVSLQLGLRGPNYSIVSACTTGTQEFDVSDYASQIYAGIKKFDPLVCLTKKDIKKFDTFIPYGIAAALQAFTDSAITVNEENAD